MAHIVVTSHMEARAITDRACSLDSYFDKHHMVAYSTHIVCSAHRIMQDIASLHCYKATSKYIELP